MSAQHCPRCPATLVSIAITISGRPRVMQSCSNCDYREWRIGEPTAARDALPLSGVLAEISDERRAMAQRR